MVKSRFKRLNTHRRKCGRKRKYVIKDANKQSRDTFILNLRKIGGSIDSLYTDHTKGSNYSWTRLEPLAVSRSHEIDENRRKVLSLRQICARVIAHNANSLDSSYFEFASPQCWIIVWREVLALDKDSFRVFSMFASYCTSESGFRSHSIPKVIADYRKCKDGSKSKVLRQKALHSNLIPKLGIHRIENVFSNVLIQSFVKTLHGLSYHPLVLLDLSFAAKSMSKDELILIFNLPNLVALNISNNLHVDDHYIQCLVSSIEKDDKLSKLTILKIQNCPNVTESGIQRLFDLTHEDCINNSLALILTDHYMLEPETRVSYCEDVSDNKQIHGSKWFLVHPQSSEGKLMAKLPLGLCLHILYRLYHKCVIKRAGEFSFNSTNSWRYLYLIQRNILLDFMFFSESEDTNKSVDRTWEMRLSSRNQKDSKAFCYIINNNLDSNVDTNHREVVNQAISSNDDKLKRKKPVIRNTNARHYFKF